MKILARKLTQGEIKKTTVVFAGVPVAREDIKDLATLGFNVFNLANPYDEISNVIANGGRGANAWLSALTLGELVKSFRATNGGLTSQQTREAHKIESYISAIGGAVRKTQ